MSIGWLHRFDGWPQLGGDLVENLRGKADILKGMPEGVWSSPERLLSPRHPQPHVLPLQLAATAHWGRCLRRWQKMSGQKGRTKMPCVGASNAPYKCWPILRFGERHGESRERRKRLEIKDRHLRGPVRVKL